MSLFKKIGSKKSRPFRPADTDVLVSDTLVASIWIEESESGKPRINFKLNRVNPKDQTKTFGTLTIASIYEIPEAIRNLAQMLSEVESLSAEERNSLKLVAVAMEAAGKAFDSNGLDEEEAKRPDAKGAILKRLAA